MLPTIEEIRKIAAEKYVHIHPDDWGITTGVGPTWVLDNKARMCCPMGVLLLHTLDVTTISDPESCISYTYKVTPEFIVGYLDGFDNNQQKDDKGLEEDYLAGYERGKADRAEVVTNEIDS